MTLLRGFVTTVSRAASAFVEALDTLRRKLHATKSAQAAADALGSEFGITMQVSKAESYLGLRAFRAFLCSQPYIR